MPADEERVQEWLIVVHLKCNQNQHTKCLTSVQKWTRSSMVHDERSPTQSLLSRETQAWMGSLQKVPKHKPFIRCGAWSMTDRWSMRAIVTHSGPTTGGGRRARRTYDRRGCLKKEDKYASGLMLHRTPDRALKNRTVRPKAGRMATLVYTEP